jgi:hypothetical protein
VTNRVGWLAHFLESLIRARARVDAIEARLAGRSCGAPPEGAGPLPEALAGVQELLNDDDPRVAHLQQSLLGSFEADVAALEARLDRAVGVAAPIRRREFRVLPGGRAL